MHGRRRVAGLVTIAAVVAAGVSTRGAVAEEHFTFHAPDIVHGGGEEVLGDQGA